MRLNQITKMEPNIHKLTKYSNTSNLPSKLGGHWLIIAAIAIITTSAIAVLSFHSNSSAIPIRTPPDVDKIPALREPKAKAFAQESTTSLAQDTPAKVTFPSCLKVLPTFGGNTAIQCNDKLIGDTRFEYFEAIEPLIILGSEYGLSELPGNPDMLVRTGAFEDRNRLLITDTQNLRLIDIRSTYSKEALLKWLKDLNTMQ